MALPIICDSGVPADSLGEEQTGTMEMAVLVDNTSDDARLAAEHGLSFFLEVSGQKILFDTGQGPALPRNAHLFGIDLNKLDALVLSHGHYDHTGGIPEVLRQNPSLPIYAHPDLFNPRYSRRESPPHKPIGIPQAACEVLSSHLARINWTTVPTRIAKGFWATGAIPRTNDIEDTGGAFYLDPDGLRPDPIEGDQAIWVNTPKGIVVILGCAHSGVINTLDHIAKITGAEQFHAVIGGMHLLNADQNRLGRTLEALKRYRIQKLGPCHCTGQPAQAFLQEAFKDEYLEIQVGLRLAFS